MPQAVPPMPLKDPLVYTEPPVMITWATVGVEVGESLGIGDGRVQRAAGDADDAARVRGGGTAVAKAGGVLEARRFDEAAVDGDVARMDIAGIAPSGYPDVIAPLPSRRWNMIGRNAIVVVEVALGPAS